MNAVLKPLTVTTKRLRNIEAVEDYIRAEMHGNTSHFGEWVIDGLTNFSHDDAAELFERIKQGNADAVLEMVTNAVVGQYAKNAGVR